MMVDDDKNPIFINRDRGVLVNRGDLPAVASSKATFSRANYINFASSNEIKVFKQVKILYCYSMAMKFQIL